MSEEFYVGPQALGEPPRSDTPDLEREAFRVRFIEAYDDAMRKLGPPSNPFLDGMGTVFALFGPAQTPHEQAAKATRDAARTEWTVLRRVVMSDL